MLLVVALVIALVIANGSVGQSKPRSEQPLPHAGLAHYVDHDTDPTTQRRTGTTPRCGTPSEVKRDTNFVV